jgi:uncharacterized protein YlxW (UPF0749 family)
MIKVILLACGIFATTSVWACETGHADLMKKSASTESSIQAAKEMTNATSKEVAALSESQSSEIQSVHSRLIKESMAVSNDVVGDGVRWMLSFYRDLFVFVLQSLGGNRG